MTSLKVTELTVWNNELFGLSEEGHLVAWNNDMGSWILRGACEIKNLSCENEHMIKIDRAVERPLNRHEAWPGGVEIIPPETFPLFTRKERVVIYLIATVPAIATAILIYKLFA